MDQEDLYSIVAYVRSLEPIPNPRPNKRLKRLFKYIERTFPKPYDPSASSGSIQQGGLWGISGDHWRLRFLSYYDDHLQKAYRQDGLGWWEFIPAPRGRQGIFSQHFPDPETGIGDWLEDDFVELF